MCEYSNRMFLGNGKAVPVPISNNTPSSITLNIGCSLIQYALPLLKPIEVLKRTWYMTRTIIGLRHTPTDKVQVKIVG